MTAAAAALTLEGVNPTEPDPGAAALTDPSRSDAPPGSAGSPALADAADIVARAETDEAAARVARDRYREAPIQPLTELPAGAAAALGGDAIAFAVRAGATLNAGRDGMPGYGGTLYLTGTHLVVAGQVTMSIPLADITETALGGERLLLSLRNGEGVTLDVSQPRLLRAELAAVRHWSRP